MEAKSDINVDNTTPLQMAGSDWVALLLFLSVSLVSRGANARSLKKVELQLVPGMCSKQKRCQLEGRLIRSSVWLKHKPRSRGQSMMAAIRRFTRERVKFAPLEVTVGSFQVRIHTDHRGYFRLTAPLPKNTSAWTPGMILWHVRHKPKPQSPYQPTEAFSYALFPTSEKGVSLITDVDDTLIKTFVTQKRKLLKLFLFRNATQIPVVPGALAFLRRVLKAPENQGGGVLHYLTGSPFAIHDRVQRLLTSRAFPPGALHMKKLSGAHRDPLRRSYRYKLRKIRTILRMYPRQKFLLLGDSGEQDPEVYQQARREFPRQVVAIFIRAVPRSHMSRKRFAGIHVFSQYKQALQKAKKLGYIP